MNNSISAYNGKIKFKSKINNQARNNIFLKLLAYAAIFTSSFDIALNVEISGLNFRFCQLMIIILSMFVLLNIMTNKRIVIPMGSGLILTYALLNTLFILNSIYKKNAIGYDLWLLLNIVMIFDFVNLFTDKINMIKLFKVYIYAFIFVAAIGLLQFIFVNLFGIDFYMNGYENRIHAFCYEPSYFSTYLLTGWCLLAYMFETKCTVLFSLKKTRNYLIFITIILLLSTSRMGLLMMALYIIFRGIASLRKSVKFGRGQIDINKSKFKIFMFIIFIVVLALFYILYLYLFNYSKLLEMVYGLGILGTAGHSATARENSLGDTLKIFFDSPIIGCSLGDIDARIARNLGIMYTGTTGMSMSIFAEQFAATGIIGGLLFLIYLFKLIFASYSKKYNEIYNNEYIKFFRGLCLGFAFQVIILNMNQNVLRTYFWVNVAVISVAYRCLRFYKI